MIKVRVYSRQNGKYIGTGKILTKPVRIYVLLNTETQSVRIPSNPEVYPGIILSDKETVQQAETVKIIMDDGKVVYGIDHTFRIQEKTKKMFVQDANNFIMANIADESKLTEEDYNKFLSMISNIAQELWIKSNGEIVEELEND